MLKFKPGDVVRIDDVEAIVVNARYDFSTFYYECVVFVNEGREHFFIARYKEEEITALIKRKGY